MDKYEEALQKAKAAYGGATDHVRTILEGIFPELAESDDERIRMALCDIVRDMPYMETELRAHGLTVEQVLAYLERQKEEEGYEAIPIKSTLEYKLGFKAGEESEKQKEQKPISSFDIVPYIDDKIAALQDMWREEKVAFDWDDMHEMIEDVARHFYQKEQKPAEWSEEDIDKMVNERARKSGTTKTEMQFYRQGIKDTLKSLRPQPKQEDRYMEGYMQGLSDAEKSYNDRVAYHIDKMRDEKG